MFTLAQYVFGIGKPDDETLTNENCSSKNTAFYESDVQQCVQTNIENDWILIEVEQNSNLAKDDTKPVLAPRKTKLKSKEKLQSQEESWFVDPPECFKNSSPDSLDVKTSSLENLLIEHPSMSVFDNFFTKMPTLISSPKINTNLLKKMPSFPLIVKKNDNKGKENAVVARPNKKKPETVSVNILAPANPNKAFTAVIQSGETFNKKKTITKKNYERKNKVAVQRNGPIMQHKKMFTHLNGVYHTRHHC